jgi:hypothetical protein
VLELTAFDTRAQVTEDLDAAVTGVRADGRGYPPPDADGG